ncbi:MAG: cation:proton antiporter [Candidatus Omnitrophota bacterium]|jgi:Kef-type K+ transport system membrane component KefB
MDEHNILIFLIQVVILLGFARMLGELFRIWKQPALTAEIMVGVIFGPTILGRFFPSVSRYIFPAEPLQAAMLETIAWLGVFFFLLEMGLELDFSSAWRQRGNALKIALSDIIIPMAIAFIPAFFIPSHYLVDPDQRLIFAFFIATVMTISALPIAARALRDLDIYKTDLGFLIMSALSVNDIIGWLIFTLILGFFTQMDIQVSRVIIILLSTLGFTVFCLTVGRRWADIVVTRIKEKNIPEPAGSLTFICILGFLCGAITQKIGIHALFGFFVAGVMVGGAKALPERTRHVISQMVYAIFVPLFFASIGLRVDFVKNFDIFIVLILIVIGIFGRFIGAWIGVNLSSVSRVNRLTIAIAHTPGGSMEIVVGILALQYNLITEPIFVGIVFSAVFSSVILGPWLRHAVLKREEINIMEFSRTHNIIANMKSTERNAAMQELCSLVAEQGNTPHPEALYRAVAARENTMGTAIEEGIALPHARIPRLVKPVIALGISEAGIEWDSPDGKPTHLIFLILTPREDDWIQVQILRIISKAMSSKKIRDAFLSAGERHNIWHILQQVFTPHQIVRKKERR